jgi:TRAP-type mannitol/chloroaromatic compound transport system permease small subunit
LEALLKLSRLIDRINESIGKFIMWLVLAAVVISSLNAVVRKAFDFSSNAFLEVQWYLFGAVFMLGAGYVFLRNAHVRIDFISTKLSPRTNAIIDALGIVVFTIPLALILIHLSWPLFAQAWVSGERSANAGGLIRWPVLLMIPVGFAILAVQALSELIKRIAYIRGLIPEPFTPEAEKVDEETLAQELAAELEKQNRIAGGRA